MKSFRVISLLIVLGSFLCLNGRTCLPCFITLVYHQFVPEDHQHDPSNESRSACPFDQFQEEEQDHEHQHLCPNTQNHSRLVPVTKVLSKTIEYSFKSFEAKWPPGPTIPEDQIIGSTFKLRRWFNICEAISDQPLYLQHAQFLI